MKNNSLRFNSDGKFTILQVSDPQDVVLPRKAMLKMLDRAYDRFNPDLVLFTGDNVLGNHIDEPFACGFKLYKKKENVYGRMSEALNNVLEPVNRRNIPFAMIFGNHDDLNCITKDEQLEIYKSYASCLNMNTDDKSVDCDTYNISILSSSGDKIIFNLWMLDSAWYDKDADKAYWKIKKETVDWYNSRFSELKIENSGNPVPSLMFIHVPLENLENLTVPCEPVETGAVKTGVDTFVKLNTDIAAGVLGEKICPVEDDGGLFESVKKNGDVKAVVSGHDHSNCFDGVTEGVRLIQTSAASFRCSGSKSRGVRVFVLDENNPDGFDTDFYTYDQLCGTGIRSSVRYFLDADELAKYRAAAFSALLPAAGTLIYKTVKLWRRRGENNIE